MECICGANIPLSNSDFGPIATIKSLKFYTNTSMFGHPSSRQRFCFCDECTEALIEFLRGRRADGPGAREVSE